MDTLMTIYRQKKRRSLITLLLLTVFLMLAIYVSSIYAKIDLQLFFRDHSRALNLLADFLKPDWSVLPKMIYTAMQTLLLALLGTMLGAVISFFFAVYAASNLSSRAANVISRMLIALERSISEVILILLLIAIFGLGMFPGVIAVGIGCLGMLGKLYAESIEEIPSSTLDAIRATGASKMQLIVMGVLPAVAPALISHTILRFEINIRVSVFLGAIGAGGIGFELQKAYRYFAYGEMTVALMVILVLIFLSERLSVWWRNRLLRAA